MPNAIAALERLTDAVARAQSFEDIFERGLECLDHALGAERAALLLFDEHGTMRFVAQHGLSEAYRRAAEGHSPWRPDDSDALPIFVNDVQACPTLGPEILAAAEREDIRAMAFVPLCYGGRVLGKFMLYYRTPRAFEPDEVSVARIVAGHIAFAVAQMRSREEFAHAKDELETIFSAVGEGIAVYHADGRLRWINPAGSELIHVFTEEFTTRFALFSEAGEPIAEEELPGYLALASGKREQRIFRAKHRQTGDERWFRARAEPVLAPGGRMRFAVVVFADLTEQRRALEAAHEAERRKDEFLAMLGHELRNPLSPIVTALSLMDMDGGDHFARERAIIGRQVRHMLRLVDDLLDISRITRGKLELKRRTVDAREVVRRAVEMVSPLLEQRRHRLEIDVPSEEPLWVDGDPDRLEQVLSNLLTNSAKYTDPGGRVEVRASRNGTNVLLRVRDNGVGIEPELLPELFNLFQQGRQRLDRSSGGLGLGLAIVRRMVEMHGGEITITSEGRGRGTEAVVTLPIASIRRSNDSPRPCATLGPAAAPQRTRVLVVDDNGDAADTIASTLDALGYRTAVAYDGPCALEEAARFAPDVAVLDIGLPVMDGYELARRLRSRHRGLRLIALTGYGQQRDRRRALEAGFAEHLVKPVELPELLQAIAQQTATL